MWKTLLLTEKQPPYMCHRKNNENVGEPLYFLFPSQKDRFRLITQQTANVRLPPCPHFKVLETPGIESRDPRSGIPFEALGNEMRSGGGIVCVSISLRRVHFCSCRRLTAGKLEKMPFCCPLPFAIKEMELLSGRWQVQNFAPEGKMRAGELAFIHCTLNQ